jgi:hypothetical protein
MSKFSEASKTYAIFPEENFPNNSGYNLAYDLGLGLKLPIDKSFSLSLAYQYFNGGIATSKNGLASDGDSHELALPKLKATMAGTQLLGQLSYRF